MIALTAMASAPAIQTAPIVATIHITQRERPVWQRTVREEQEREDEQDDGGSPHWLQQHGHGTEREPAVSHAVVEDRVRASGVHHDDEERHAEQAPTHGVARLASGYHETDEDRHDAKSGQDCCGCCELVGVRG